MGAMLWSLFGLYRGNARTALRAAQKDFFEQNYDLATLLDERIEATMQSVATVQNNDEYGLLDTYQDSLNRLNAIRKKPLPHSVNRQIETLRTIEAIGSSALNNILDLRGVSDSRQEGMLCPLSSEEMQIAFETNKPTRWHSEQRRWNLYDSIGRGEAIGFPVYRAANPRSQVGWYFIGNSPD